jgi:putative membrane protein insertion efficiency factor
MSLEHPTRFAIARTAASAIARAPRLVGRALIKAYRLMLSPLVGFDCRHLPTCSEYGDAALARFGLWAGGWMTLARLCRCHPWGTSGLDIVPEALPPRSHWYTPWRYGRWRSTNSPPIERPSEVDFRAKAGLDKAPGA